MARWFVEYCPLINCDLDQPDLGREVPGFRIFPEGERERWIAQTNPNLSREVQEEAALLIAEALSQLLGI
jgi:hypothetical protein